MQRLFELKNYDKYSFFRQQHKDAIQELACRHTTAATAERLLQDSSIFSSGHQSGADMLAKEDKTSLALLEPPEQVSS